VDFRYSEEQLALQDTLQRYIAREYSFEARRGFSRAEPGYSARAWQEMANLGLLALPLPETFGGLNGSGVDVMVVMEQLGRGLMLEPYLSTVVLCGGILRDAADTAVQQQLLPKIAAGETKLALAAYEASGRYELAHVSCQAVRAGNEWHLSGHKAVVLDAPSADYFLVSARSAGAVADPHGLSLFLVRRDAPGVALFAYPTQSGGRAADLELNAVVADALIGPPEAALPLIENGIDWALAALCAEALGVIALLNEATLTHLKTRRQFGVPIGTFQALQHRMADMYVAAEQARSMAILAAMQLGARAGAARRRLLSGAKAYVGRAARFIGQQGVQLHGGMGLVDEFVVGHAFKRLTMIDLTYGDADHHFGRFCDSMPTAQSPQDSGTSDAATAR
jgi:alkylation response protein AidB-like acyl-CoA dehydrogenase